MGGFLSGLASRMREVGGITGRGGGGMPSPAPSLAAAMSGRPAIGAMPPAPVAPPPTPAAQYSDPYEAAKQARLSGAPPPMPEMSGWGSMMPMRGPTPLRRPVDGAPPIGAAGPGAMPSKMMPQGPPPPMMASIASAMGPKPNIPPPPIASVAAGRMRPTGRVFGGKTRRY